MNGTMSSGLLNERPKATKSKESAPEVLSYRQRLYDRETLMLPSEPWNPAARLAQVCFALGHRLHALRSGGACGRRARPNDLRAAAHAFTAQSPSLCSSCLCLF